MAYALILLRKAGYPCVFYGDYYGTAGDNSFDGKKDSIDKFIHLRQTCCFGDEDNYFENENLIGWVRKGNEENDSNAAVVMSNKEYGKIKMHMEDGNLLAIGEHVSNSEFIENYNIIEIPSDETYAVNCIRMNDYVIMPEGFPKTRKILDGLGYKVLETPMSEFEKMDGGLTCLSLRF